MFTVHTVHHEGGVNKVLARTNNPALWQNNDPWFREADKRLAGCDRLRLLGLTFLKKWQCTLATTHEQKNP